MKRLLFILGFIVGLGFTSWAQTITPIGTNYTNFANKSEVWVCSSVVTPIDMSISAFGKQLSGEGYWAEVKSGTHTDGSKVPTSSEIIGAFPASNVFNPVGRNEGVYEFIFINEDANFCGMPVGAQSVFRIYIVPELVDYSITTEICPSQTGTVDLLQSLPSSIKNFAIAMGWTIDVKLAGTIVTMPINVSAALIGTKTYTYEINDKVGNFAGKFSGMLSAYKCASSKWISHTVTLIQDKPNVPALKEVTYCYSNVVSGILNVPTFKVDLNEILGVSLPGGIWSVSDPYSIVSTGGVASINTNTLKGNIPHTIDFTYTYTYCDGKTKGTSHVKLTFATDSELNPLITDVTRPVCRNLSAGAVNLFSFLNISIPSTSGIWINQNGEIIDGTTNVSKLITGSSYKYTYILSSVASENLCNISKYIANLTLQVKDAGNTPSGESQMCKDLLATGTTKLNLSSMVVGLSLIDPNEIKWYAWDWTTGAFSTTPITTPDAYTISSTTARLGVNQFKYVYSSECGISEGMLYFTITDRITNFTDKTIRYCFTDAGAIDINLFQVLGVSGLTGKWEYVVGSSTGGAMVATNFDGTTFKGSAQYGNTPAGEKTYVFKYKALPADGSCVKDEVTVTVILTPDIVTP